MVFNSVTYVVFLVLVLLLYWWLPHRARLWMLFVSSLAFYGFWRFDFLAIMVFSAGLDYVAAIKMSQTENSLVRRALLATSLSLNLGLLAYFKYLQFAVDTVWSLGSFVGLPAESPALGIVLPLGISFYTFQTISYTIDVYRRQATPIRDFVLYGCFVVYFPQLVAGPILRLSEVCPQLVNRPAFRWDDQVEGIRRILAGLFLKVFLADNIAGLVNDGFKVQPGLLSAIDVWTLAFLFGFQIYFDFSAYSHIAMGSARLMGIRFPENFNFPYLAVSPKDFWGRWHISLSSWIRDYLYLPLCGVAFGKKSAGGLGQALEVSSTSKRTFALFATWSIMGLWHGAGLNFLLWGIYHALAVYAYRKSEGARESLPNSIRVAGGWAITLPVMMLSWVLFRAENATHAGQLLQRVMDPLAYAKLGLRENNYLVAALLVLTFLMAAWVHRFGFTLIDRLKWGAAPIYAAAYAVAIVIVIVFLRPVEQFIYFQF